MGQPSKSSVVKFNVLVVDDDSTSLSIVSASLKSWQYEVMTVKSGVDALATIRVNNIDLVVTDLHMPKMNGLQLQKQIEEEFKLPVIIMSSDDRESTILNSLASGAVFYIVKPINPNDLKNVWQYVVASRKGKSSCIEEIGSIQAVGSFEHFASASSVNEGKPNKKDSKRKSSKREKEDREGENNMAPKKAKVVWTNSLHNRFLEAIKHISLERAVPKKILEFMNVPGLSRENVASHLQKYRLFLKRVAEKGCGTLSKNFTERALRSSFASGHSSLLLKNALEYAQITGNKYQMITSFQHGFGGSSLNSTNIGSMGFPSLGASNSNSASHVGTMVNLSNFHQPLISNTNPLCQANGGTAFGTGSDDNGTNLLSSLAGVSLQAGNLKQSLKNFDSSGWKPSSTSGYENMGSINSSYSNYAGIRINDDGKLLRIGQKRVNANSLNGTGNDDVSAGLTGKATFPYLAQGESSNSAGLQNASCQFSSALSGANEQEKAPVLPTLSQQKYNLGNNGQNDFTFADLMNNASAFGNTANPDKFGEGIDIGDLLFNPTGYQFPFQQQGGDNVLNSNFLGGLYQPEINLPTNQSPNPDLSGSFGFEENPLWNIEPTLEQLQEIEEFVDPNLGSNASLDDYDPSLNQTPHQQQDNEEHINSELINGKYPLDNPSENQNWDDDEFINSLFGDRPF